MKLLLRWVLNAVALLGIAYYLPGIEVNGFYAVLIIALVLGLVNALVRPILVVLTLPITIVTLGLFILVINALLFWFTSMVVKGFEVDGFISAFIGALIMTVVSWVVSALIKKKD